MRVEKSNRVCAGVGRGRMTPRFGSIVSQFQDMALKSSLDVEEDGRSRKGIVFVCSYDFGEKSCYQIDGGSNEVLHCSNLLF